MNNEIKRLREVLDLTQLEFALKIGMTPPSVSLWERGEQIPGERALRKIKELAESNGIQWNPEIPDK